MREVCLFTFMERRMEQEENLRELEPQILRLEKKLASISQQIEFEKERLKIPAYKDPRFWGGVIGLPLLICTGWLADSLSDNIEALRLLHKGLGTEIALESALNDENESTIKAAVSKLSKKNAQKLFLETFQLGTEHFNILSDLEECDDGRSFQRLKENDESIVCFSDNKSTTVNIPRTETTYLNFRLAVIFQKTTFKLPEDSISSQYIETSGEAIEDKFNQYMTVRLNEEQLNFEYKRIQADHKFEGQTFKMEIFDSCSNRLSGPKPHYRENVADQFPVDVVEFALNTSVSGEYEKIAVWQALVFLFIESSETEGDCFKSLV